MSGGREFGTQTRAVTGRNGARVVIVRDVRESLGDRVPEGRVHKLLPLRLILLWFARTSLTA
jgi:hypothetical protein